MIIMTQTLVRVLIPRATAQSWQSATLLLQMPAGEDHEDDDHDGVGDHDHENYEVDHLKL